MKESVKFAAIVAIIGGVTAPAFGETYTLAGKDEMGYSSLAGTCSVGWRNESGTVFQSHKPCAGNDYVIGNGGAERNYGLVAEGAGPVRVPMRFCQGRRGPGRQTGL